MQPPGLFQQLFPISYYYYCDSRVTFEVNTTRVEVEMSNARLYPFSRPALARSEIYMLEWIAYFSYVTVYAKRAILGVSRFEL